MCGIAGYVGPDRFHRLLPALDAIRHRGPDARGTHQARFGDDVHIGIGHVRLSIIDLSSHADQPMTSGDGHHVLAYNGEIYNHRELRSDLQRLGWPFRTSSDTEVLLAALVNWGTAALARMDGIFAFAWLDRIRRRLTLARDRLGVKPLYLTAGSRQSPLYFASELRAVRALSERPLVPDESRFSEFLLNGFIYEPITGIRDIEKVPPGSSIEIDLSNGERKCMVFAEALLPGRASTSTLLGDLLEDATQAQLFADVQVGLSFSGGVDSTVLAMAARGQVRGLFVADDADPNAASAGDAPYAHRIAQSLGLEIDQVNTADQPLDNEAFLETVSHVARGTEEPISNYTYVASETVSRMARDRGYKVLLSGLGGDELFAGYPRHRLLTHHGHLNTAAPALRFLLPVIRRLRRLAKKADRLLSFAQEQDFGLAYSHLIGYFNAAEVQALLGDDRGIRSFREHIAKRLEPVRHCSTLRQGMYLDLQGFLSQNLTITDKSSMAHGVEVRVPLLSNALLEFAASLESGEFDLRHQGKKPLRDYLLTRLPNELVNRQKSPFNPSLDAPIRRLGSAILIDELTHGPVASVLDSRFITAWIHEHFHGAANHTYRLWQLLYFSRWLRELPRI